MARQGEARRGSARQGISFFVRFTARQGMAGLGAARRGKARRNFFATNSWPGRAGHGEAWQGKA